MYPVNCGKASSRRISEDGLVSRATSRCGFVRIKIGMRIVIPESSQKSHIDSILKNRDLRQKKFVEQDLNPILLEVGQPDQQFMNEVMNILEKNYADPQFGVKDLTERLNISYTVIYKKFVSLTGLPPVRFIQLYRLQIAKKILESSTTSLYQNIYGGGI